MRWTGVAGALLALALLAGCGDGSGIADAAVDPGVAPDLPVDESPAGDGDLGERDPGPGEPDLGPPDVGPQDLGPQDLGPQDVGPQDVGPSDPGQPDVPPIDPGPSFDASQNLSEVAEACTYVVESLCDKVAPKCDFMGLLPENWLATCTNWLVSYHYTVSGACTSLDEMETTNPDVMLIKQMGPLALRECVDNFECTMETAQEVGAFIWPMINGGAAPSTGDILGLVAGLCFK